MKGIIVFASFLLLTMAVSAQTTIWTFGTARNVPKNQAEFGIIHPLQIGLSNTLEMSVSPLMGLSLAPNISFKNRWYTAERIMFASQHSFVMPTLLTRFMGDGFLFQNDTIFSQIQDTVPYQFYFRNKGIVTYRLGSETLLSGNVGFAFALQTKGDSLPYFERALFYPYSSTLNDKFNWNVGLQIDGNIVKNHNYSASIDFHSIGLGVDNWALVHKGYYIYNHSIKFAVLAGYRMVYASYPSGNRFNVMPVIDLIWKINAKKEPMKDLFRL